MRSYKCVNGQDPKYLAKCFTKIEIWYSLSSKLTKFVPRTMTKAFDDRDFFCSRFKEWNSLPTEIQLLFFCSFFARHTSAFFFGCGFCKGPWHILYRRESYRNAIIILIANETKSTESVILAFSRSILHISAY